MKLVYVFFVIFVLAVLVIIIYKSYFEKEEISGERYSPLLEAKDISEYFQLLEGVVDRGEIIDLPESDGFLVEFKLKP